MAYENINISFPNFCIGPLSGTFCSVDLSSGTTILRILNATGGTVVNYNFGSNIVNEFISLEYVGPLNLIDMCDGLIFFTTEKISSTTFIIKKWETNVATTQLNLKQSIIKTTTGSYYFDVIDVAVEHYRTKFYDDCEGSINYVYVSNTANISNGDVLFLGPSSDTDNIGVSESKTVNLVSGNKVYFTNNVIHQYTEGDQICFYKKFHVLSNIGLGGAMESASFFRLGNLGGIEATSTSQMYKGISAIKWSIDYRSIASVHHKNLLFINPYNNYLNLRSMFLNNSKSDKNDEFIIEDIVFDGNSLYKLMKGFCVKNDDNILADVNWEYYNFWADSLLPYSNSMILYSLDDYMIGRNDTTIIMVNVRDQFNVGLRDLTVRLFKDGDSLAEFTPIDGYILTDKDGLAHAIYKSGVLYSGHTLITGRVTGGSPTSGSGYLISNFNILSKAGNQSFDFSVRQKAFSGFNRLKQTFQSISYKKIRTKSRFTSTGGDYFPVTAAIPSPDCEYGEPPLPPVIHRYIAEDSFIPAVEMDELHPLPNRIKVTKYFQGYRQVSSPTVFKIPDGTGEHEKVPDANILQKYEKGEMTFSQLNLSFHSYKVGDSYYNYLWTYVKLNQFIFVEDAIPVFWSEKNPKDTNIWLRLRPFAFSLDDSTLVMKAREVSYEGDTGYIDVTSQISINTFDAGGGLLGLEVLYDPINDFHHDAIVYISIEVYDTAYDPNFIWVNYWFSIIPDYRFPYLENLSPERGETNVSVDSNISFDLKDDGVGVDITTFEMFLNSRIVIPNITRISNNHYYIEYNPSNNLLYGKKYAVKVHVADLSEHENRLNDRYEFYTAESSGIDFVPIYPQACRRGMPKFTDIEFLALSSGDGIDQSTIRLQAGGYDLTNKSKILPILYRIS